MLVYRVELPDGTGPWCNHDGIWHTSNPLSTGHHISLSSWSSPCCITVSWPRHEKGNWRFGFTNWNQFFNYCKYDYDSKRKKEKKIEALNIIKDKGMFISVYDVPDLAVIKDVTQCVFRIAEATLVERLDSLSDVVMDQLSIYLGEPTKKDKDEQEAGDTSFIRYSRYQTNYEGIVA